MVYERDINKSKSKSKSKTRNNNIRKIPDMTNNSGWHISTIHIGLSYMGGNLRRPKILVGGNIAAEGSLPAHRGLSSLLLTVNERIFMLMNIHTTLSSASSAFKFKI